MRGVPESEGNQNRDVEAWLLVAAGFVEAALLAVGIVMM
jgi:hypothetical protein